MNTEAVDSDAVPRDPRALLAQIADRAPETFAVEYLRSGPAAWRLSLVRETA